MKEAIKSLVQAAANAPEHSKGPSGRAAWLATADLVGTGHESRVKTLIASWKSAGMWVHADGTLEQVLGISTKGVYEARAAAESPGQIDDVAAWCAYDLNPSGELRVLLNTAVERVAHTIVQALRGDPETQYDRPIGSTAESDARLVEVRPLGDGLHRITVKEPEEFRGYWVEFSRESTSIDLDLRKPKAQDQ